MTDYGRGTGIARALASRFSNLRPAPGAEADGTRLAEGVDGRTYVIKDLPAGADGDGLCLRFQAEADAVRAAALSHVVAFEEAAVVDDRLIAIRAFRPGATIIEHIARKRVSVPALMGLCCRVLSALSDLHACGVLHRNFKPSNIIVGGDREAISIIDVGIVRDLGNVRGSEDLPATVARYVSPEQAGLVHHDVQESTDLYLFGLILFEAFAGRPAFDGVKFGELLRQHLTSAPPSLRARGVDVPRALDDVLERLLRKDPRDRYRSAAGVLADLRAITTGLTQGEANPTVVVGGNDRRDRLTEPGFIGREAELGVLVEAVLEARRGRGALVSIEAESGGGKSRLIDELAARAEPLGSWVLRGRCQDHVASRPFQLLDGLVTELAARAKELPESGAALRERLGPDADTVACVMPALAGVLAVEPRVVGPEAFGEVRTLHAVSRLFDALGTAERPVLILLDDCQWTDELTANLLQRWATNNGGPRHVSIVVAFRPEEVAGGHPIRTLPGRHVVLSRFSPAEVRSLVVSMAGPVPEEAVDLVVRMAAGNPFMAGSVLRGMVETGALTAATEGWRIEASGIADVRSSGHAVSMLHRRLRLFTPDARQLLTSAAVVGKEFDLAAAVELSGVAPEQAEDLVAEVSARHVVWPTFEEGRYAFTHDKLRESLLESLSSEERSRLHRAAARRLERAPAAAAVYDLAYHFDAAGEAHRAFVYALAAADEARARHALEIAERYYRIAERGADAMPAAACYRVSVGLGDILMLRGDYEGAAEAFAAAAVHAETAVARAELHGKVGELAFKRGDPRHAYGAIGEGLRLLGEPVPRTYFGFIAQALREGVVQALHTLFPRLMVARRAEAGEAERVMIRLYSRLTYAYWFTRGRIPTLWAHLRAMNLAERHPPTAELAQAYSEHAPVTTMIPWLARGLRYATRSLELRRDRADVWGQGQSLHFLGIVHYAAGRYREAIEACREAARVLDRTGDRWEASTARWHIAIAMYRLGELVQAIREARACYEGGVEIGDRQTRGIALGIWAKASEGQVPEDLVRRELAEETGDVHTTAELLMADATLALREGRTAAAVEALEHAHERVRAVRIRQEYVAPVQPWLATALRKHLQALPPWAERERASVERRLQRAVRRACRVTRSYRNSRPHAQREAGYLAALQGRGRKARKLFARSLAEAREHGARYEEALTLEAIGEVGSALRWRGADDAARRADQMLTVLRDGVEKASLDRVEDERASLSLVDRFTSTVDSGRKIASARSADAVYSATYEALVAMLRCDEGAVLTFSDEGEQAVSYEIAAGAVRAGYCRELIGRAVRSGRPVTYSAEDNKGLADADGLDGIASAICAPIVSRGRATACIYATHRYVAGLFGEDEERLVAFVATIAGAALDNADGIKQLEELNALLDARSRELERSNAELSQFAYVASHDLQEPLRNVAGYIQLFERHYPERVDEQAKRYIQGAVGGVERMRTLISDLLMYSRIGTRLRPMERVDLGELLDEVSTAMVERFDAIEGVVTRDKLPIVVADRGQLAQVFQNLLSNAAKFTGTEPVRVHVWAHRDEREWTISVRDNGIGIDPSYADQIFVLFKRLHTRSEYPGTGIGLAICSKVVTRHGGRIWVESNLGQGATFRFTLPVLADDL